MSLKLSEYSYILYYCLLVIILVYIILKLAEFCSSSKFDEEKLSAYECGFEPFINARVKFDITFVLIAFLFLVFDIEIIFLIPWVIYYEEIGFLGYVSMFFFIIILFLGFLVEWCRGVLDWDTDLL